MALALNALGIVAYQRGRYSEADQRVRGALECWRAVGDIFSIVWGLNNLGVLAMDQGRLEEARNRLAEALALGREVVAPSGTILCLANLGDLSVRLGEYRRAAAYLREGIRLAHELGYSSNLLNLLTYTVEWLVGLGRTRAAARLSGALLARREALGQPVSQADTQRWEKALQAARGALDDGEFTTYQDGGRIVEIDWAVADALRELESLLLETPA
jgi:tetratricopeptide (TPR) repeat protein